jgi:hypothetical protein
VYRKLNFILFLLLFFFVVAPVYAQDDQKCEVCSTTKGCYCPGLGIAGPDCSCSRIEGGDDIVNEYCINYCPADCVWSEWSECSVKCGYGGQQTRTIEVPAQGGGSCVGAFTKDCNTQACPWRRDSECDTTIGQYLCEQVGQNEETEGQITYETRETCVGDDQCKVISPIDCQWSDWSECSLSCGGGTQTRIIETYPSNGGQECGNKATQDCNTQNCPIDCQWSDWSECSLSCGGGTQTRSKTPAQYGGEECVGEATQDCNTNDCPWYRTDICNTETGEYPCVNDGNQGDRITYEMEDECVGDDKCVKDIGDECTKSNSKVMKDFFDKYWVYKKYTLPEIKKLRTWAVGDVNDDNYDDIVFVSGLKVDNYKTYIDFLINQKEKTEKFVFDEGKSVLTPHHSYQYTFFVDVIEDVKNKIIFSKKISDNIRNIEDVPFFLWNKNSEWIEAGDFGDMAEGLNFKLGSKQIDIDNDGYKDLIIPFSAGSAYSNPQWRLFKKNDNLESLDNTGSMFSEIQRDIVSRSNTADLLPNKNLIDFVDFYKDERLDLVWTPKSNNVYIYMNEKHEYWEEKNILSEPIIIDLSGEDYVKNAAPTREFNNVYSDTVITTDLNGDNVEDLVVVANGTYYNFDTNKYYNKQFILIYEAKTQIKNEEKSFYFEFKKGITLCDYVKDLSGISLDFNNDGIKDIVFLDKQKTNVYVLIGNSNFNCEFGFLEVGSQNEDINDKNIWFEGYRTATDISVANFDNKGGDDFIIFYPNSAMIYLNSNSPKQCNTCSGNNNKSKGDADCDGDIDLIDFEIWRDEFFEVTNEEGESYNWQTDFNCGGRGLKRPTMSDFSIWRMNFFGV